MLAFVLSGAGNRGPLEVGALQALVEEGVAPDFIVGTSAGAINSLYVAAHGLTPDSIQAMGDLWRSVSTKTIYPEGLFQVGWRLITRADSLYSNKGMRATIRNALPAGVQSFADLTMPLYVTATDLRTSRLFLFGEEGSAPLVDAVLASASVPGIHPPVTYQDLQLVDGGVVANVAATVAMEEGATTIYMINASYGGGAVEPARGVLEVVGQTISTMTAQALFDDLARAEADENVDLYHIHLDAFQGISFRDFSKTDEMIRIGYERTKAFLAAPPPPHLVAPAAPRKGATVDGARELIPPNRR